MLPRNEYPRPQFERKFWTNLNGEWEFEFDDERVGDRERWGSGKKKFSRKIIVPFTFQSELSGIGDPSFHDVVWYRKEVDLQELRGDDPNRDVILHFGAVDYEAWVWVNGELAAHHEGGHTPFSANITNLLVEGSNVIVVKAEDFSKDMALPRGKQYWKEKSEIIWYTRTTGIWQTVWAEAVHPTHLEKVYYTPDIDFSEIHIRTFIRNVPADPQAELKLRVQIRFGEETVSDDIYSVRSADESRSIRIRHADKPAAHLWSPEHPHLYDVRFTLLLNDTVIDEVDSYFGMRKISVEKGKLKLNNHPYYMRLVLDQGYFPKGVLTPPSDEDVKRDVELTKEMGFNGARKHQKVEDPRWLYWCDKLGLLVWGEAANAFDFSEQYVERFTKEWMEVIERDRNHPSIVVWVPLNESWGVPNLENDVRQRDHALAMYHLTRSLDPTRLVISNDGWEHVKSDLVTIHDYEWRREVLENRYSTIDNALAIMPAGKHMLVGDVEYAGEPILVTEFGGIAYKKSDWEGWGYSGAENDEDFVKRLRDVFEPIAGSSFIQGFCYTQLTDVEQEINGLLTYDREPKIPLEQIRKVVRGEK